MATSAHVTQVLKALSSGDARAADELLPLVYDYLREKARGLMRRERTGHTLDPTALVHEAYVNLIHQTEVVWNDRAHFCAVAARAMRRILKDYAKADGRLKRGGGWQKISLTQAAAEVAGQSETDATTVDIAFGKLESIDPQRARIVELRFFCDLTVAEVATALGVSERTVERQWRSARTWLFAELHQKAS